MYKRSGLLFLLISLFFVEGNSQDSTAVTWNVQTADSDSGSYILIFTANIKPGWQLYSPNQDLSGTSSMEINFVDSSFSVTPPFMFVNGKSENKKVALFNDSSFSIFYSNADFSIPLNIKGNIPSHASSGR